MNIIEKLGITQGPWECDNENHDHVISDDYHTIDAGCHTDSCITENGFFIQTPISKADIKIIAAAPEMLEDGLYNCQLIERMKECILEPDKLYIMIGQMKTSSYKKATGKSWQEIKELINE